MDDERKSPAANEDSVDSDSVESRANAAINWYSNRSQHTY